jgi:hypothetical protein
MTTVAQAGILGFGPSAGKGSGVTAGSWFRHKAAQIDLAVLDDQRLGPPEVGGRPLPTIPYKAGVMVGGGMTLNPRLEASIGWLLAGALGDSTSTSGSGTIKNHTFRINATTPGLVRWMGFRKYIPSDGNVGNYGLGEIYKDCKITNFIFTLPNDGLVSARVDAVGREFELVESPNWGITSGSTGGWDPTYGEFEDYPSLPIGSTPGGYIRTPVFGDLPVVQAQIGIQNMPLDPRMEKVYGSPYLEDVTIVSRAVTLDLTVKWTNPDLYRQILTGSVSGTTWSSAPFTSQLDFMCLAPTNIPGETLPYQLHVYVNEAMLALQGGIQLAGNNAVMMRFTGTALDVSGDYVTFDLRNAYANYTWPT